MAKFIAQIIVAGAQVVGRAFVRAVRQEFQASQQAAEARSGKQGTKRAATDALTGLSLQEAKQILNVKDINDVEKSYEHLFNVNEKSKGGSFYLQSKIVRAKERFDQEHQQQSQAEQEASKQQKTSHKDETEQS